MAIVFYEITVLTPFPTVNSRRAFAITSLRRTLTAVALICVTYVEVAATSWRCLRFFGRGCFCQRGFDTGKLAYEEFFSDEKSI